MKQINVRGYHNDAHRVIMANLTNVELMTAMKGCTWRDRMSMFIFPVFFRK